MWVAGPWQVEQVTLDRGAGLRPWIEIRRGDERYYCSSIAQLHEFLYSHGIDMGELVDPDQPPRLLDPRDGCE